MTDVLAGRAATFSKSPSFWSGDPTFEPKRLDYGRGSHVWGSDGREYVDWVSGLGAISLGYPTNDIADSRPANRWAEAVAAQVWDGAGFSLPHPLEQEVAKKLTAMLQAHVPGWQNQPLGLRWGKTGSDACEMAVRLARAVTGRSDVISIGYHGWLSWAVSATPPAWGIPRPQYVSAVPFGDLPALKQRIQDIDPRERLYTLANGPHPPQLAAVIIEQPPQPIPDGYWSGLRKLCDDYGALLIVDEVVTGLRYGLGGACERFEIRPDIICMGKALGNGLPISCMVGRREYWSWFSRQDPVFISSTHFGDAVSLASANAVLDCWDDRAVEHVWQIGQALMVELRSVGIEVVGYPPVSLCQFGTASERAFFVREMARRGVLINRPNVPNLVHTLEDVEQTVQAAGDVMFAMTRVDVEEVMRGKLPITLFSNR